MQLRPLSLTLLTDRQINTDTDYSGVFPVLRSYAFLDKHMG